VLLQPYCNCHARLHALMHLALQVLCG
jgi:hypothetical protein